jgi:hypothetical protein
MANGPFLNFLRNQRIKGMELAAASDILQLVPVNGPLGEPQLYIARFHCKSLVKQSAGQIVPSDLSQVAIAFHDDHLRRADNYEVLTWMHPHNAFHPNIRPPVICVGERFMTRGKGLVEILYQLHSVIIFNKWAAARGLNEEACQWARRHSGLFPTDPRPLKRRRIEVEMCV